MQFNLGYLKLAAIIPVIWLGGIIVQLSYLQTTKTTTLGFSTQIVQQKVPIPEPIKSGIWLIGALIAIGGSATLAYSGATDLQRIKLITPPEPQPELEPEPEPEPEPVPLPPEFNLAQISIPVEPPDRQRPVSSLPFYKRPNGLEQIFSGQYKLLRYAQSSSLVLFTGGTGAGKSTLAAALLRDRLLKDHECIIFNHHQRYGEYHPLKVYGKGETLKDQVAEIAQGMQELISIQEERIRISRQCPPEEWEFLSHPVTIVMEEIGDYEKFIQLGYLESELLENFMNKLLISIRKANIFFIGVSTHRQFNPEGSLKSMMSDSFVHFHLYNEPDCNQPGGFSPAMEGIITFNGENVREIKIPSLTNYFPPKQLKLGTQPLFQFTDLISRQGKLAQSLL